MFCCFFQKKYIVVLELRSVLSASLKFESREGDSGRLVLALIGSIPTVLFIYFDVSIVLLVLRY